MWEWERQEFEGGGVRRLKIENERRSDTKFVNDKNKPKETTPKMKHKLKRDPF